jgi:hypothetical protein
VFFFSSVCNNLDTVIFFLFSSADPPLRTSSVLRSLNRNILLWIRLGLEIMNNNLIKPNKSSSLILLHFIDGILFYSVENIVLVR